MTRARRILRVLMVAGLTLAGVAAWVASLALSAVTGVDPRPYRTLPAYAATEARLREVEARSAVSFGPLRAGFGRARLTPRLGTTADAPERGEFKKVPLAGYGSRHGEGATGVHDELWVKAVAFEAAGRTGVVITADALIIPREVAVAAGKPIAARWGVEPGRIYFSATHTHAGMGGWGEGWVAEQFAGGYQPGTRLWLAQQMTDAAEQALADLQPAELGSGGFAAPEFVRNRLVGDRGPVDPEFAFMVVRQAGGRVAILGSYAAHATVLPSSVMEFSGDYPGCWQRAVEQATGGMALFLAGGVGSHGPRAPEPGYAGARRMGEDLAAALLRAVAETPCTNRVAVGWVEIPVDLPEAQVRLSDALRLRPWVAGRLLPVGRQTRVEGFRLGHSVWLSAPCDFSGELALGLKAPLKARGLWPAVTSFNGDYVGYVIPSKYYHGEGYEPRTMSFFGPQWPEYLTEVLGRLGAVLGAEPEFEGGIRLPF